MTNYWVLQANPKLYDIDRALGELSTIHWRAPRYTGAIAVGDGVAIWRSGADAGFIGVGRVIGLPGEMEPIEAEAAYELQPAGHGRETLLPVAIAPSPFVPKATIAALSSWSEHPIVRAPMGTVFPVSADQWADLAPLIGTIPDARLDLAPELPPVFAWEQRGKDTYPMPGGYSGYLDSLRTLAERVKERPPNRAGLEAWMRSEFGSSETNARFGAGFLLRVGVLVERGDLIELGDITRIWLSSGNIHYLVALLHSRVRFIGEMLRAAIEPRTIAELLAIANEDYAAGWTTTAQIQRRRGWLQSAGMLTETDGDRVQITDEGRRLLDLLTLQDPISGRMRQAVTAPTTPEQPVDATERDDEIVDVSLGNDVEQLIQRLFETGNDGAQHEQFEIEAAEAFGRLGFHAQWLGKSGRTDVLLEAELGLGASYRVIVDCKSTGRGSVSNQIDWDTIDEHRELHQADYAVVLAPDFGGGRLSDRALAHRTVLLKIEDLAELLRLHAQTPLTLDDYRTIFTSADVSNPTAVVAEIAEEAQRRLDIAAAVVELLVARGTRMGPMNARDFFGALIDRDDLPDATSEEIEAILAVLGSPLLGLLNRLPDGTVRFATTPGTAASVLRRVARLLDD